MPCCASAPLLQDDAQDTKAVHVYAEAGPLPHTSQQQVQKQTPAAVPLAGTEYAQLSGRLVDMVSAMRSAGAQAELDLPAIVVVGIRRGVACWASSLAAVSLHVPGQLRIISDCSQHSGKQNFKLAMWPGPSCCKVHHPVLHHIQYVH
jgi:hypothetical protein